MSRVYYLLTAVLILIGITGCTNVSYVPTVPLSSHESSLIKSWGIVTATCAKISYDVDVSVTPVYTGGGLLGAISAVVDASFEASAIESSIESGGTAAMGLFLDDWNFDNIFRQTFYKEFKANQSGAKIHSLDNVLYEDLDNDSLPQAAHKCDAILDIHVTHYGLESTSTHGFSVFMNATLEVIRVRDKQKIASHTIRFDKEFVDALKVQIYNLYVKQQSELKRKQLPEGASFSYTEFKRTVPPPATIFSIPFTVRQSAEYFENDAALLKTQLKLAATEVSRAFIKFLQLKGYIGLQATMSEYLSRPSI
ncbi:hypothetical protein GF337_18305 [candidate division KSB1 bacterium]|nr:hypothetical protein [candidate division KSB1 bacterium]